jgi:hypothetical protein
VPAFRPSFNTCQAGEGPFPIASPRQATSTRICSSRARPEAADLQANQGFNGIPELAGRHRLGSHRRPYPGGASPAPPVTSCQPRSVASSRARMDRLQGARRRPEAQVVIHSLPGRRVVPQQPPVRRFPGRCIAARTTRIHWRTSTLGQSDGCHGRRLVRWCSLWPEVAETRPTDSSNSHWRHAGEFVKTLARLRDFGQASDSAAARPHIPSTRSWLMAWTPRLTSNLAPAWPTHAARTAGPTT